MPLIDETNSFNSSTNQAENFSTNQSFKSNPSTKAFNPTNQNPFNAQSTNNFNQSNPSPGIFHIPEKYLQLIPWIPVALEMLTGQKIPPSGVLADLLNGIQQLQFSVQQVSQQQQLIWNKLESLEQNASNQLNSLSQQLANTNSNFKLLATETKRSLEFSRQPALHEAPNE